MCVTGVATAIAVAAGSARGHDALPRVWIAVPAQGVARHHLSLISIVWISMDAATNPTVLADDICDRILSRNLSMDRCVHRPLSGTPSF